MREAIPHPHSLEQQATPHATSDFEGCRTTTQPSPGVSACQAHSPHPLSLFPSRPPSYRRSCGMPFHVQLVGVLVALYGPAPLRQSSQRGLQDRKGESEPLGGCFVRRNGLEAGLKGLHMYCSALARQGCAMITLDRPRY